MCAGFTDEARPVGFYDDWLTVADEEGKHYLLLAERLAALGFAYGDLPAHDGLWQAAEETAHDLLARLAVVPLVLEARGLDVTPARSEEHTSELQSLMRNSYTVFCLKKKNSTPKFKTIIR